MGSTPNEIVVTVRLHMDYKHLYDCHMDYIYHAHIDLSSLIKHDKTIEKPMVIYRL